MRGCHCRGNLLCEQCQALAARAGVLPVLDSAHQLSEAAFQAAVVRLAREHGWLCYHTHDSRRSLPGYPDLTIAKAGKPIVFAELKVPGGSLTLQQHAWLEALTLAQGKEVAVWTPEQWPLIQARLRG